MNRPLSQGTADSGPLTVETLSREFARAGIEPGITLIVHSSLSSMGHVRGGAATVVLALEDVLGKDGTLAMPAHTNPPQRPTDDMVPFDVATTSALRMGTIPEHFRQQEGTLRSDHPLTSWAACGPNTQTITAGHALAMSQGETSPLARLYECDAKVLLLGVSYDVNTSLHLAEYRCRWAPEKKCKRGAAISVNGQTVWTEYDDIYWYCEDLKTIGVAFENETSAVRKAPVGSARVKLFSQRQIVDFAVAWMNEFRRLD